MVEPVKPIIVESNISENASGNSSDEVQDLIKVKFDVFELTPEMSVELNGIPSFPPIEVPPPPCLKHFENAPHPLSGAKVSKSTPGVDPSSHKYDGVLFGAKAPVTKQLIPDGMTKEAHFEMGCKTFPPYLEQAAVPDFVSRTISTAQKLGKNGVLRFRNQMRTHIQAVADHPWCVKLNSVWQRTRPRHCREVNGRLYGVLLLYLIHLAGFQANNLANVFHQGFPYTGVFPPFGGWIPGDFPPPESMDNLVPDPREALRRCVDRVKRQESEMINETWRATMKEKDMGILYGPFRASPEQEDLPDLPWDKRLAFVPRFGIPHNSDVGRARPIDDGKFAKINRAGQWSECPWLPSIDTVIAAIQLTMKNGHGVKMFKLDHDAAYKRWPTTERDMYLSCLVVMDPNRGPAGEPVVFISKALVFGTIGSVHGYCSFSQLLCILCNRLFLSPLLGYVDDFMGVEREDLIQSSFENIIWLHEILGVLLKEKKSIPPCLSTDILGLPVSINNDTKIVLVIPSLERRTQGIAMLTDIISEKRLSKAVARKVGGKLSFLSGAIWGRLGRVAMYVLWQYTKYNKNPIVSIGDLIYFKFLLEIVATAPPREIEMQPNVDERVIMWLDGAWANDRGGVGGIVVLVNKFGETLKRFYFAEEVSKEIRESWQTQRRKQFNTQAEILACVMAIETFADIVFGKYLVIYEDNTGAQFNCLRGCARVPESAKLVATFWSLCSKYRAIPWFERVRTDANPGDNPSRFELKLPEKLQCTRRPGIVPSDMLSRFSVESTITPPSKRPRQVEHESSNKKTRNH